MMSYVLVWKDGKQKNYEATSPEELGEYLKLFIHNERYPKSKSYRQSVAEAPAKIANPFCRTYECEDFNIYKVRIE